MTPEPLRDPLPDIEVEAARERATPVRRRRHGIPTRRTVRTTVRVRRSRAHCTRLLAVPAGC
jgi:hypothetical protein